MKTRSITMRRFCIVALWLVFVIAANILLFHVVKEQVIVHGDKAHSCYFSRDAYANMVKDSKYAANKELLLISGASHTDLYDGGRDHVISFDRLAAFFEENMK